MNQEKFGVFIQQLRKEKNMTQQELGDLLGINGKSVSKWERGINYPDISILAEIANIFNISVEELLNCERKKCISNDDNKYFKRLLLLTILIIIFLLSILIYNNYYRYDVYHIESENEILEVDGYIIFNPDNEMILINNLHLQNDLLIKTNELTITLQNNNQTLFNYHSKKYQEETNIQDILNETKINIKKPNNHNNLNNLKLTILYNNDEINVSLRISEKLK